MNDLVDVKKTKDRSPGFPFIDLQTAIDRARQIFDEEGRTAVPQLRIFMHWRYSEKSSGALQTVAALRSYGLLEEAGGGSGSARQLKLTDLALRILLDQREDATEREGYILKAALNPPVARDVYTKWPEKMPQDSTVNHHLVFEKKFTQSSATSATKILKQNHIFAKVSAFDSLSCPVKIDSEEEYANMENTIDAPVAPRREQANVGAPSRLPAPRHNAPGTPEPELVYLPDGKVFTVQFNAVPDLAAYQMLKAFVDFKVLMFSAAKGAGKDNSSHDKTETGSEANQS